MKVHCPSCQAVFSVPDEKIPQGKDVRLLCLKCRMPIELNREQLQQADAQSESMSDILQDEEWLPVDMLDDGSDALLLCVSDASITAKVEAALKGLNFQIHKAATAKAALTELRYNRYDVVILDESLEGTSREMNPVLRYVQPLPMQIRRQFFLCLISESLPSLDQIIAFRLGVNLVLNVKDLDRSKVILDRVLKEHRRFYKVLREELDAKGRI